ncbi:hypothetical protein MRB53_016011 [Persea americana]|uniref:Uncharacterized protein n=1 Tax=Persea americana TaxID=3435 RepID=A0ACC2M296_PERAE|nr:hypothetical protein MRB53_016011 [Persea americana]
MRDNDSHVAFFSSAITLHWLLTTPMQSSLLPSQMKVEGLSFALLIFLSNPLVPHLISSKHFRYMGFFAIEPSWSLNQWQGIKLAIDYAKKFSHTQSWPTAACRLVTATECKELELKAVSIIPVYHLGFEECKGSFLNGSGVSSLYPSLAAAGC